MEDIEKSCVNCGWCVQQTLYKILNHGVQMTPAMRNPKDESMYTLRVGNNGHTETWKWEARTLLQFNRIREISGRWDFDFTCVSMVFEDTPNMDTFSFTYYTRNGDMHVDSISPKGKVTKSVVVNTKGQATVLNNNKITRGVRK